ncbi:hypothetical protein B0H16DRAFT_1750193 [Mycena metata]|uniref:Uncharacterized protein n=1 Tax=Mycena metata TaxID=1033252 RepID=A0AAD7GIY0_9AGAR|nr:hypothetical protein B0H16DRAFT_1750193 [Mycena metata]
MARCMPPLSRFALTPQIAARLIPTAVQVRAVFTYPESTLRAGSPGRGAPQRTLLSPAYVHGDEQASRANTTASPQRYDDTPSLSTSPGYLPCKLEDPLESDAPLGLALARRLQDELLEDRVGAGNDASRTLLRFDSMIANATFIQPTPRPSPAPSAHSPTPPSRDIDSIRRDSRTPRHLSWAMHVPPVLPSRTRPAAPTKCTGHPPRVPANTHSCPVRLDPPPTRPRTHHYVPPRIPWYTHACPIMASCAHAPTPRTPLEAARHPSHRAHHARRFELAPPPPTSASSADLPRLSPRNPHTLPPPQQALTTTKTLQRLLRPLPLPLGRMGWCGRREAAEIKSDAARAPRRDESLRAVNLARPHVAEIESEMGGMAIAREYAPRDADDDDARTPPGTDADTDTPRGGTHDKALRPR